MNNVALCMIVKNEERYLSECLQSVQGVVDEIVVVDTGSSDATKSIAKKFGAKIFDYKWNKDFSAARNFALAKCHSEWILYLDADERLSEKSKNIIKSLAETSGNVAYYCNVVSPSDALGTPSVMKFLRFFKKHPKAEFTGKVHEQIEPSLKKLNYKFFDSEIVIMHEGYNIDKNALKRKAERNLELLLADYRTNPSAYNAFQIGQTYLMLEKPELANSYFIKTLNIGGLDKAHTAQTLRYVGAFELSKGNIEQAEKHMLQGLNFSPFSPLLHVLAANIYIEKNLPEKAAKHVKYAYEYNKELLEGKRSSAFDVLINEKNMLLYGINLALLINDRELFTFFYPKIQKADISSSDKLLLELYNSIYVKGEIPESILTRLEEIKSKIDEKILAKALVYLSDKAKKSAERLAENFGNNFEIQFLLGEKFFEKDRRFSKKFFERALELRPADLNTLWSLFNVYFSELNIGKLESLLDTAKKYHSGNAELINVFGRIVTKLKNLPDATEKQ